MKSIIVIASIYTFIFLTIAAAVINIATAIRKVVKYIKKKKHEKRMKKGNIYII